MFFNVFSTFSKCSNVSLCFLPVVLDAIASPSSHWQESRSRKISRRNDSIISLSLEKIEFSVLFLVSIFKMLRKKFSFSSRFMRFFKPFSFSSRFSRFVRKILFLFSIYEILKQDSLSLLEFSRFLEKNLFLFSFDDIFKTIPFLFSIFQNP